MLFLLYPMATSLYFELKGQKKKAFSFWNVQSSTRARHSSSYGTGGNLGTSLLIHTRRHHKNAKDLY